MDHPRKIRVTADFALSKKFDFRKTWFKISLFFMIPTSASFGMKSQFAINSRSAKVTKGHGPFTGDLFLSKVPKLFPSLFKFTRCLTFIHFLWEKIDEFLHEKMTKFLQLLTLENFTIIVTSNIQNLFRNLFRVTGILVTVSKMGDIEKNELRYRKWSVTLGGHWNRIGQLWRLKWPEDRPFWHFKFSMLPDLMKYRRKSADGRMKISCSQYCVYSFNISCKLLKPW